MIYFRFLADGCGGPGPSGRSDFLVPNPGRWPGLQHDAPLALGRFDGSAPIERLGVRAADTTARRFAATLFVNPRIPIASPGQKGLRLRLAGKCTRRPQAVVRTMQTRFRPRLRSILQETGMRLRSHRAGAKPGRRLSTPTRAGCRGAGVRRGCRRRSPD